MRVLTPSACLRCERAIRPRQSLAADYPGTVQSAGRGICANCYRSCLLDDTLADYDTLRRRDVDVIEDVELQVSAGRTVTGKMMASALGMEWKSLYQTLRRHGRQDLLRSLGVVVRPPRKKS